MHIIIVGSGRVGVNIASFLISDGHDVVLIETNTNVCNIAATELDALVLCGNCTDPQLLEEACIEEADVFVSVTGNDDTNLLAAMLAKEYKVPKIIARVTDPRHEKVFKKIGVDLIINPERVFAIYLEKLIIRPEITDLVILGKGDAELIDLTVESKKTIGKRIGDLSPTDDFLIVAVYENGNIVIPKPEMVLKEGMKVSILVKTEYAPKILEIFTK
ncbi:TrkA family potassium uptake protein [uncultured Methanobacterium sp.]|uniref:potassium channel family protein n=1 Tax=uncultured Methanobacterium sp. TaxID=176306 RepID=UPI002AA87F55|nr:TrkA family potassium uptake protein [uncultured Methanobacterium sp.]